MPLLSQNTVNQITPLHQQTYDYVLNKLGNGLFSLNYNSTSVFINLGDLLGGTATDAELPNTLPFVGQLDKPTDCYFWFSDELTRIQNIVANLLKITGILNGAVTDISTDDIQLINVVYTSILGLIDDILTNYMNRIYPEADRNGTRTQCVINSPGFIKNTGIGIVDAYVGSRVIPVFAHSPLNRSEILDIKVACNQILGLAISTDNVIDNLPNVTGSGNVGVGQGTTEGLIPIPTVQTGTTGLLELINRIYVAQNNNFYTLITRATEITQKTSKSLQQTSRIIGDLKSFHDSENNSLYEIKIRLKDNSDNQDAYHQSENDALYEISINTQRIMSSLEQVQNDIITLFANIDTINNYITQSNQVISTNLQLIADAIPDKNSLQQALQQLENSNNSYYNDIVSRLNEISNKIR